ncbi:hypothetical protein Rsub_06881 [Raphidocelis subcapitata]|uniref:MYND-type domain-containing protein n=1 Tax=Raphidocelis subcapitata TaxID=307507 RepID=A0A2V0P4P3_9CHLO|nr:hypothetical protein Rsub_06881 [Raphidocelis subcapitata]|eukprot:GBF93882.1 hypothetical protein Rsub_06881 [Raphidocelis subcapitata]
MKVKAGRVVRVQTGPELSFAVMNDAAHQFLSQHKELAAALEEFLGRQPCGREARGVLPFTLALDHLRSAGRLAHALSSSPGPFAEVAVFNSLDPGVVSLRLTCGERSPYIGGVHDVFGLLKEKKAAADVGQRTVIALEAFVRHYQQLASRPKGFVALGKVPPGSAHHSLLLGGCATLVQWLGAAHAHGALDALLNHAPPGVKVAWGGMPWTKLLVAAAEVAEGLLVPGTPLPEDRLENWLAFQVLQWAALWTAVEEAKRGKWGASAAPSSDVTAALSSEDSKTLRLLLQRLMDGGNDGGSSSSGSGSSEGDSETRQVELLLAAVRCGGAGAERAGSGTGASAAEAAAAAAGAGANDRPAVRLVLPAVPAEAEPYGGDSGDGDGGGGGKTGKGSGNGAGHKGGSSGDGGTSGSGGGKGGGGDAGYDLAALATALSALPARLLAATLRGSPLGPRGLPEGGLRPRLPPAWLRGGPAPLLALCRALAARLELRCVADAAMRDAAAALLRVAAEVHRVPAMSRSAYDALYVSEALFHGAHPNRDFFASGPEACGLGWKPQRAEAALAAPPPAQPGGDGDGDGDGAGARVDVRLGDARDEDWRRKRLLRAAVDVAAACRTLRDSGSEAAAADGAAAGGAGRRAAAGEAPLQIDPHFWRRLVVDYYKSARPEGWELQQQHMPRQASEANGTEHFWILAAACLSHDALPLEPPTAALLYSFPESVLWQGTSTEVLLELRQATKAVDLARAQAGMLLAELASLEAVGQPDDGPLTSESRMAPGTPPVAQLEALLKLSCLASHDPAVVAHWPSPRGAPGHIPPLTPAAALSGPVHLAAALADAADRVPAPSLSGGADAWLPAEALDAALREAGCGGGGGGGGSGGGGGGGGGGGEGGGGGGAAAPRNCPEQWRSPALQRPSPWTTAGHESARHALAGLWVLEMEEGGLDWSDMEQRLAACSAAAERASRAGLVPWLRAALLPLRNALEHQLRRMAAWQRCSRARGILDSPEGAAWLKANDCTGCLEPLKPGSAVFCESCDVAAFCSARCFEEGPYSRDHSRVCDATLAFIVDTCHDQAAAAAQRLGQAGCADQATAAAVTASGLEQAFAGLRERLQWPHGRIPPAAADPPIAIRPGDGGADGDGADGSGSELTDFSSATSDGAGSDLACQSCDEG